MADNAYKQSSRYLRMKADQHWDMAGLARQDRDSADEKRHTELARDYDRRAGEAAKAGL